MLYLKNTLGGLSRSLTDSALSSFQGPHRWWKLALFAVLFVLPGGSVGVMVLAWVEHRRGRKSGTGSAAGFIAGSRRGGHGPCFGCTLSDTRGRRVPRCRREGRTAGVQRLQKLIVPHRRDTRLCRCAFSGCPASPARPCKKQVRNSM